MGGIFSSPTPPAPDPSIAASQRAQEARLAKQESRADARESAENRRLSSQRRSRRTGGLNLLLADRDNAQAGLEDDALQMTLGNSLT